MSQENVEIVRRVYEAVARRDPVTPFETYAEDIVWDLSRASRGAMWKRPVYKGHDGVRELWREGLAAFGAVDYVVVDLADVGERVLAEVRERMVGRASGAPVEALHYAIWTLVDGKVTRIQVFDDRAEAEAAAGLSSG
jgi:ketosteroid isomerase-like protein